MRHQMKVTTNRSPLHIRSGPGMSYRIVGTLARHSSHIFIDVKKPSDGWRWYKLENGKGWSCGYRADYRATYLKFEKDLTPPPKPPAPPPPPPPPPQKDYSGIQDKLDDYADIDSSNIKFDGRNAWGSRAMSDKRGMESEPSVREVSQRSTSKASPTTLTSTMNKNLSNIRYNLNVLQNDYSFYSRMFTEFDRFKVALPDYHLSKAFSYVFFTRPDLNIIKPSDGTLHYQCAKDPVFYYLYRNNKSLLLSLTRHLTSKHELLPFLCNTAESFEVSDEFIKTIEHGETFTGYKVKYGTHNIESRTAGSFSIQYTDDKNFNIYKLHKAWVEYISRVYRGEFAPLHEYVYKKILDYAASVYYVVCAEDGETILFWTKYWGVFPTNIPSSSSSWTKGSLLKTPQFSINYSYSFKEDFTPLILAEFNMNTKSKGGIEYRTTFEPALGSTGPTFAGAPFIETKVNTNGQYVYKLKFKHKP